MRAGILAPPRNVSLAISIVAAVMGCGFFLSTWVVNLLKAIMNVDTFLPIIPVVLTIDIVLLIVTAIYIFSTK
ncbi:MAG: hypothetical protein ACOX7U_08245 [Desulfitobacteriia bacterium]